MVKKKKSPPPINDKKIKDMLEALKQAGIPWQQTTIPNKTKRPPVMIPTVWTIPPKDKDWEERLEDEQTVAFMQECRERTASMKDDEKCARCKLRFRCYTEIKIEKKRKTRVRQVLYNQSINPIMTDKIDESIDWLKVIKDVAENTRPDTKEKV